MQKQIQLRGISRTPSDRMTSDGGCSESLNVQVQEQELAPALAPKDVTSVLTGASGYANTDYIYIHKTPSYTNYITLSDNNDVGAVKGGAYSAIGLNLGSETFKSISSIGNTLIIVTDAHMHYVLYKEGEYKYLGTKIPEPLVEFVAIPVDNADGAVMEDEICLYEGGVDNWKYTLAELKAVINTYSEKYDVYSGTADEPSAREVIDAVSRNVWELILGLESVNRAKGYFSAPVFARSAVRLYDGSYIYQSVPVMLGLGFNQFVDVTAVSHAGDTNNMAQHPHFVAKLNTVYRIQATIDYPIGDWSDIIGSLDIALTPCIYNPVYNDRVMKAEDKGSDLRLFFKEQTGYNVFDDIRDAVLSKSLFYEVESIMPEDIIAGMVKDIKAFKQDELVVKPVVPDDEWSHHETTATGEIMQYNQRIIMSGVRTKLYTGHPYLQGVFVDKYATKLPDESAFAFKYHIRTDDGSSYSVIGRSANGTELFPAPSYAGYDGYPCGWLYYPDPRCHKVEVYTKGMRYTIPMKPHPSLNGSYALCSLDEPVIIMTDGLPSVDAVPSEENPVFEDRNKLVMTEVANPFYIPMGNRLTFTDNIIDTATTTKALSTGQFGQYPLYVFTEGGIYAVTIGSDGKFTSSSPLSRDVALSAEAVTPIDQAIVFVTAKGVKMLMGSDIAELSPYMNGEHYVLTDQLRAYLEQTSFSDLLPALTDNTPFMSFMKEAQAVQDYAGGRLIYFRSDKPYQYVYMLGTQTWHKLCLLPSAATFSRVLNGYPDALVTMKGSTYGIYDFSTFLDVADTEQTALKGVVITRAIDLDNDNVRKMVRRLKLRGHYWKGFVKWLLMASNDGMEYHVIHSLHGCSYKLFRVVLLMDLKPTERFSYIDMDFETRFTNKVR